MIRQWVGTLNGVQNAQVRARETGYLQTIAYQQGGYVKKGDLLFEIDPRPFVAALDQAKSQLAAAQATLLGVELDAKRAKELFQSKVISEQEYTNKTQDYQTKLASAAAAQAAVDDAQLNLDLYENRFAARWHRRTAAGADWRFSWLRLQYGLDDGFPDRSNLVPLPDQ